jgi:hypothetical protein
MKFAFECLSAGHRDTLIMLINYSYNAHWITNLILQHLVFLEVDIMTLVLFGSSYHLEWYILI